MTDLIDKHLSSLFDDPPESGEETAASPEQEQSPPASETDLSEDSSQLIATNDLPQAPAPGTVPSLPEAVEETPATEGQAASVPVAELSPPPPIDYQKIAEARLREIKTLRTRVRASNEQHSSTLARLQQEMDEVKKALRGDGSIDPALLEADPALKHVATRLQSMETELQQRRQAEQEAIDLQRTTQETVRYAQESKADFVRHTPEWQQAYEYTRAAYAKATGIENDPQREARLNLMEHEAVGQWMQDGEDPALKIYEMAIELGWRPVAAAPVAPRVQTQPVAPANAGRVRRVREAVNSPSPSVIGQRDVGRDMMSREQFYANYSESERIRIFNNPNNGDDIFETLIKTNQVPLSMIEAATSSPR